MGGTCFFWRFLVYRLLERDHNVTILTSSKTKDLFGTKVKRLFTEPFSFRKEQISVLVDFGMEIEGVLKSSYKINGKYCDSVIQSVINK